MSELIRKKDALDALMAERKHLLANGQKGAEHVLTHHGYNVIDELPPVQSDVPVINVGDMISRRDAIDAVCTDCCGGNHDHDCRFYPDCDNLKSIKAIPPVQPEREQMYKKAFSVACELLIGANLFGITEETMFKEIMEKDGIVSSLGYERYILDNLERLTGEDDGTD